ncbi:hypothetical protein ACCS44_21185 [Rhizobium ruizarguesonis]|nr:MULTISPECIES: hypothetical protein [Rhizobium]
MFYKTWLAIAFATVAAYYIGHSYVLMKEAVSAYHRDGSGTEE